MADGLDRAFRAELRGLARRRRTTGKVGLTYGMAQRRDGFLRRP